MAAATATRKRSRRAVDKVLTRLSPADRKAYESMPEEVDYVPHPDYRLVRTEHESARSGRKLERWHNLFGGWGREAKRRPARQTAAPPPDPAPDEFVPPGGVGDPREGQPRNTACEQTVPPEEAAPPRRQRPAPPPRRMSKSKRRELAGLPPEKKRRIPVVPPPGYGLDEPFVPRPGGQVVRHLVCGKVFLGST